MGHKAADTTHNINNTFGPGTANECAVQWVKKFCEGDKSLEDDEPVEVSSNHLRAIVKADPISATLE